MKSRFSEADGTRQKRRNKRVAKATERDRKHMSLEDFTVEWNNASESRMNMQ